MIRAVLTLTALLWASAPQAGCDPADADAAIAHLVEHVRSSDAQFIRNGRAHDGERAAQHMQRKAAHFDERIDTPEAFIALAATRSELTGRAYRVRLEDGTEITTANWLGAVLDAWRTSCEADAS